MAKIVGYVRVGKGELESQIQLDALLKFGCPKKNIFEDRGSGAKMPRPGLEACLAALNKGDTLITWRLDRIGRSISHLVALVEQLCQNGIHFTSICDGVIDTRNSAGNVVFDLFLSLAQFERHILSERNRRGTEDTRPRGRRGGRKKLKPSHPKVKKAKELSADRTLSVNTICRLLKVSRATYYRYLAVPDF